MKRALVLALVACGARAPAPPTTPHADVLYLTSTGRAFPLPVVRGTVAGRPTTMVLDTGAAFPVVAAWLAREVKLEATPVEPTHDPSGRLIAMQRCDAPRIAIEGLGPLDDRPTGIIDLPAEFQAAGIGAIVSPQALAPIILDLRRRELRREPLPPTAPAKGAFDLAETALCNPGSGGGGAIPGRRLSTTATVDGVATVLELDTGAVGSSLFVAAETEAGRKVLARPGAIRESGLSAAGALGVVTAPDVPFRLGEYQALGKITVLPGARDAPCGIDGRIGIDVLRSCVLVIGTELHVRCER